MEPMTSGALNGGGAWEQALYDHLTSHVENEVGLLQAYQEAADESHSAAFSYLVGLIVEEERRHHRTFAELAATLRTEVDARPEEFAVPRLGHWGFEHAHIVELTDQLLERERDDAGALAELAETLDAVKDTTMWHLLVDLMQMDTAKHIRILEFVREHASPGAT